MGGRGRYELRLGQEGIPLQSGYICQVTCPTKVYYGQTLVKLVCVSEMLIIMYNATLLLVTLSFF